MNPVGAPLRIAMISVHTCPLAALGGKETGGMNVYVRELSRELGHRGVLVDAFTRSQNPEVPHIADADLGPSVRVIHVKCGPESPYPKEEIWTYLPQFVEGVRCFIQEEGIRYDLFHSHYWLSGWAAHALQSHSPAPIIHMFHTLGLMKDRVARTPGQREVPPRAYVEAQILDFADRIVAATPSDREHMVRLYGARPDHIAVIPPGADLNLFRPVPEGEAKDVLGISPDHHMVLFVGRMDPLKGTDTFLKSVAVLVNRDPSWREQVCVGIIGGDAGEDPALMDAEMRRLYELRQALGISDVVTFQGRQAQTDLPLYYSAADVVVVPSRYESFGMVALEALACGTPVIASDVGGLAYIVADGLTGYLVPEDDPETLADRLQELLRDPRLRRSMGFLGVQRARRYAWSSIADEIEGLYDEVLNVKRNA